MPPRRAKDQKSVDAAGTMTVTAQQSRFHTEMDEENNPKEIVVKDLCISMGNRELLSHANFQLQRGRRYVLHGRNGIGKSTLLRAIATDQIPSIPRGVKVLLLGQTQLSVEEGLANLDLTDMTVLEYVIRSDERRERLLHEAGHLSAALDAVSDPCAPPRALRRVEYDRLERRLVEVRQIALRRSGARGAKTRIALNALEEESSVLQARLEQEVSGEDIGQETQKAAEVLAEVQTSLELMDASAAEAKARSVLLGLGFSRDSLAQPRSQLSGGWRTRCSLACALCQSVDLLLLDEPTNFLDLPSIIWLERFIQDMDSSTTILIVTHDRSFGDAIADELLVLREQQLERFRGNLSAYELDRLKQHKYLSRMRDAQEKQKKHMQSTIASNVEAAKRAGDDKKLKQAASRKKKLNDRMGMQVTAKGTRFKLSRDRAGYHNSMRDEIDIPKFDPPATMAIPVQVADLRFPGALVSFEKVSFSYATSKKKVPILNEVDLTIHPGDRIGLAGLNGSGKSTLVSLAMSKTLVPASGTITRHPRARFALYSQEAAEEIELLATESPELTALSHMLQVGTGLEEKEARALLSGVGLAGKTASDVPLKLLSGGQRVRLALAKIMLSPPHLLILDEVTTHLDTDTIQALVTALRHYEGAVLVVTHDRFFMKCVVEGISMRHLAVSSRPEDEEGEDEESDEDSSEDDDEAEAAVKRQRVVYRMSRGKLSRLERGMEQYEDIAARSAAKMGQA